MEIDHIMPLACGGTNEPTNLQCLCKKCHFEKTKTEHEEGYVKVSATQSTFNKQVADIVNGPLAQAFAFVECVQLSSRGPVYTLDINKCRKNRLYHSEYDFPLFTVMDQPEPFKGRLGAGLYYVETQQYFPFRGSGWYSLPMVEYGLKKFDSKKKYKKCHIPV
jgi:hypothetical protein